MMNGAILDKRASHIARHMKVNRIAAELIRLTGVGHFDVADAHLRSANHTKKPLKETVDH